MKRDWASPEAEEVWARILAELDQIRPAVEHSEPFEMGQGIVTFASNTAGALAEQTGLTGEALEACEAVALRAALVSFGVALRLALAPEFRVTVP